MTNTIHHRDKVPLISRLIGDGCGKRDLIHFVDNDLAVISLEVTPTSDHDPAVRIGEVSLFFSPFTEHLYPCLPGPHPPILALPQKSA